jgi:hypothetical protein
MDWTWTAACAKAAAAANAAPAMIALLIKLLMGVSFQSKNSDIFYARRLTC